MGRRDARDVTGRNGSAVGGHQTEYVDIIGVTIPLPFMPVTGRYQSTLLQHSDESITHTLYRINSRLNSYIEVGIANLGVVGRQLRLMYRSGMLFMVNLCTTITERNQHYRTILMAVGTIRVFNNSFPLWGVPQWLVNYGVRRKISARYILRADT